MGQKHKRFREFRTPFPLRDICENPRSKVRACAAGDGAICSKNRKIVPYHGANPNTRNGARLRSPSLIMAPGLTKAWFRLTRVQSFTTFSRERPTDPAPLTIHWLALPGLPYGAPRPSLFIFAPFRHRPPTKMLFRSLSSVEYQSKNIQLYSHFDGPFIK